MIVSQVALEHLDQQVDVSFGPLALLGGIGDARVGATQLLIRELLRRARRPRSFVMSPLAPVSGHVHPRTPDDPDRHAIPPRHAAAALVDPRQLHSVEQLLERRRQGVIRNRDGRRERPLVLGLLRGGGRGEPERENADTGRQAQDAHR